MKPLPAGELTIRTRLAYGGLVSLLYLVVAAIQVWVSRSYIFKASRTAIRDHGNYCTVLEEWKHGADLYEGVFWSFGPIPMLAYRVVDFFLNSPLLTVVVANLLWVALGCFIVVALCKTRASMVLAALVLANLFPPVETATAVTWYPPEFVFIALCGWAYRIRSHRNFFAALGLAALLMQFNKPTSPVLLAPFLVERILRHRIQVRDWPKLLVPPLAILAAGSLLMLPLYGSLDAFIRLNFPLHMLQQYESMQGDPTAIFQSLDAGWFFNHLSIPFFGLLCAGLLARSKQGEDPNMRTAWLLCLSGILAVLLYCRHRDHYLMNTHHFFIAAALIGIPAINTVRIPWALLVLPALLVGVKINAGALYQLHPLAQPLPEKPVWMRSHIFGTNPDLVELQNALGDHDVEQAAFLTRQPGLSFVTGTRNALHITWILAGWVHDDNKDRFWNEVTGSRWLVLERTPPHRTPVQILQGWATLPGALEAAQQIHGHSLRWENESFLLLEKPSVHLPSLNNP